MWTGVTGTADMSAETGDANRRPGADEQYCESCGEIIKKEAAMCPECGVQQGSAASSDKDRTTAAVLALLLGGIGGHHFYLGNAVRGVLYLLFVWTLIPPLVAFIEGIIYLTKSDEEFAQQYG